MSDDKNTKLETNDKNTSVQKNHATDPGVERKFSPLSPEEEKVSRRDLFSLGTLSAALFSSVQCSSGGNASFRGSNKERTGETVDALPVETAEPVLPDSPVSSPSPSSTPHSGAKEDQLNSTVDPFAICEKTRRDVKLLPDLANSGDQAKVVIYGKAAHAMIVVDLPNRLKVDTDILKAVSIHKADGSFIAQYVLTSADDRQDLNSETLKYWPFVFKNLSIEFGSALYIRYTFSESSEFKQLIDSISVNPTMIFRGLEVRSVMDVKVVDSSGNFIPGMNSLTPIANFGVNDSLGEPGDSLEKRFALSGVTEATDDKYNFSSYRRLRTAQQNAKFLPAVGLKGFVITDLSGNLLSENGGVNLNAPNSPIVPEKLPFVDIINYPDFICYKLVTPALPLLPFWVRTIVSTG